MKSIFAVRRNGVGVSAGLRGSEAFRTGRSVQWRTLEITLRRVIGRSDEVDPLFVARKAFERDDIKIASGNHGGLAGVERDAVEVAPAVAFAEQKKFLMVVDPKNLFVEVNPGAVFLDEDEMTREVPPAASASRNSLRFCRRFMCCRSRCPASAQPIRGM